MFYFHLFPQIMGCPEKRGPHASCATFSINIHARCLKLEEGSDALKLAPALPWDPSLWWRNWVALLFTKHLMHLFSFVGLKANL